MKAHIYLIKKFVEEVTKGRKEKKVKKELEAMGGTRNLDQKVRHLATNDNQYGEGLGNRKPLEDLKKLRWDLSQSLDIGG